MPRGKRKGVFSALSQEISQAVQTAMSQRNLPTAKDIRKLARALKTLSGIIKTLPGRVVPSFAAEAPSKRGPKPKATKKGKGCSVRGCKRPHYAKGLCASHYNLELRKKKLGLSGTAAAPKRRGRPPKAKKLAAQPAAAPKRRGRPPKEKPLVEKLPFLKVGKRGRKPSGRTCEFPGCNEKHYSKGLCRKHYMSKMYEEKYKGKKK